MRLRSPLILLTALLVLAGSVLPATAAPPVKVGVAYDAAGLGDWAFNDAVAEGAARAEADFGVKLFEKEMVKPSGAVLDTTGILEKLAKKSELVIAVGFLYGDAALAVAGQDPDTNVAVIDLTYEQTLPNLLGAHTAEHEGSFLVGAAAAMASESHAIGFLGGVEFPVIQRFEAGFVAGVLHEDPSASIEADYIDSFNDTTVMYDYALSMYESGIDVIYHAAGYAGSGLFEAARDYSASSGEHVWAIGVDFDQYWFVPDDQKPHVLTSMLKNVEVLAYDIIESYVQSTFAGGNQEWDLSTGALGFSVSGGFIDDYVADLETLEAEIIAGDIVVPTTP